MESFDLLDQALDAADENGVPYPLDVRAGMALQGYFAGLNTVAYLYSFMVDVLLRNPDVLARVTTRWTPHTTPIGSPSTNCATCPPCTAW